MHTYSIVLPDDGRGSSRRIEFEAPDAAQAMMMAGELAPARVIELREDQQTLGRLKHARAGFWVVSGSPAALG